MLRNTLLDGIRKRVHTILRLRFGEPPLDRRAEQLEQDLIRIVRETRDQLFESVLEDVKLDLAIMRNRGETVDEITEEAIYRQHGL